MTAKPAELLGANTKLPQRLEADFAKMQAAEITMLRAALVRIACPGANDEGLSVDKAALFAIQAKLIAREALGIPELDEHEMCEFCGPGDHDADCPNNWMNKV